MFYYNKASSKKTIHSKDCFHIKYSNIHNIGWFETLDEAYENGYRLCRKCNPIFANYKNELKNTSKEFERKHIRIQFHDNYIKITSDYSEWKLVLSSDGERLHLYHKNEFETERDQKSKVPGYHFQKTHYSSVTEYMNYIVDHDWYRMIHPLPIRPNPPKAPKQWTHQYKTAQKKAKKRARKQSIRNVLNLIDSLQTQPQPIV